VVADQLAPVKPGAGDVSMEALHTRLAGPQIACCEGMPHCESMSQSFLGWERPAALCKNGIATEAREGCLVGRPDWIPLSSRAF
jgi:hypothetical protein